MQPFERIMQSCTVNIFGGPEGEVPEDIQMSMDSLDALIDKKLSVLVDNPETSFVGLAPGFETSCSRHDEQGNRMWRLLGEEFPDYETLDRVNTNSFVFPIPSPYFALRCFLEIRKSWVLRKEWAEADEIHKRSFCSCLGKWKHNSGNTLHHLANLTLEQVRSITRMAYNVVIQCIL